MNKVHTTVDFFMGTNAPEGFCSLYDELTVPKEGYRSYLIKGGAGTGKSSTMKKAAAEIGKTDSLTELIHCSSDHFSLDGVIFTDKKCNIIDATPPHVIEPAYPGSFQSVVNIVSSFDEEKMQKRLLKTVALQEENNAMHKKCRSYLSCAWILLSQNKATAAVYTDYSKVIRYAKRTVDRYFKPTGKQGQKHCRLLSAFTSQGVMTFENTITALCDNIICINDDFCAVSPVLMDILCEEALKCGYTVYACYSPFLPFEAIEHLLIPELSLGFVTQSPFVKLESIAPTKRIHYTRFTDEKMLKSRKAQLSFNKKAAVELIDCAADILKKAKVVHDELETQYTDAVDFAVVDALCAELIDKISKR